MPKNGFMYLDVLYLNNINTVMQLQTTWHIIYLNETFNLKDNGMYENFNPDKQYSGLVEFEMVELLNKMLEFEWNKDKYKSWMLSKIIESASSIVPEEYFDRIKIEFKSELEEPLTKISWKYYPPSEGILTEECLKCNGKGKYEDYVVQSETFKIADGLEFPTTKKEIVTCKICNGTGRRHS